ncbi:MAG: hypothetical protein ACP5KN_09060 [Armatimonadota bacterium]
MDRLCVAFVWHMHQPWYLWPNSSRAALPFARLHATSAYYDMPWLLSRFDDTRVTFNLVPSLIEQLRGYAAGEVSDRALELSLRDPEDLGLDDQRYLLTHMCGGHPGGAMAASPRYGELLHKRGVDRNPTSIEGACRIFTKEDYRDLQVLFNLAWCGFALDHHSEVVSELRSKDRDFSEDEKRALLGEMQRAVAKVVDLYAEAAAQDRAELICSPFYHPVLPLLCNMEDAARRIPASQLPERLWREPEEARRQLRLGLDYHERIFGTRPGGLWPSEGAVSDAALEVMAAEGVQWCASDEDVLAASLDSGGRPAPEQLYRPWRTASGVSMVFRDHRLSDLVGFVYRDWRPKDAARDFLARLRSTADRAAGADLPPLVSIILDGENPWGWYPDLGEGFLAALYEGIEKTEDIQTTSVSDYLQRFGAGGELASVFPGSWIDHSYRTWIGGKEHRRAWGLLSGALEVAKRHDEAEEGFDEARRSLMIAEGSDWFWWYCENQHSLDADIFDALFRSHVAAVYERLGEEPPDAVEEPIYAEKISRLTREATGWMSATIDGRVTSYFEWRPAALLRTSGLASAMQRSQYVIHELYFGFDEENVWLRLDTDGPALQRLLGCRLEVIFQGDPEHSIVLEVPEEAQGPELDGDLCEEAECVIQRVIEARVPLRLLDAEPGATLRLAVVVGREGRVVERWPELGFLQVEVPTEEAIAASWVI